MKIIHQRFTSDLFTCRDNAANNLSPGVLAGQSRYQNNGSFKEVLSFICCCNHPQLLHIVWLRCEERTGCHGGGIESGVAGYSPDDEARGAVHGAPRRPPSRVCAGDLLAHGRRLSRSCVQHLAAAAHAKTLHEQAEYCSCMCFYLVLHSFLLIYIMCNIVLVRVQDNFSRPLGRGRLPVMVLLKRSSNSRHTRNKSDLVRQWSDAFAARIVQALSAAFPGYRVVLFSDRDEALMMCHECQIRAVAEADVLIGSIAVHINII